MEVRSGSGVGSCGLDARPVGCSKQEGGGGIWARGLAWVGGRLWSRGSRHPRTYSSSKGSYGGLRGSKEAAVSVVQSVVATDAAVWPESLVGRYLR